MSIKPPSRTVPNFSGESKKQIKIINLNEGHIHWIFIHMAIYVDPNSTPSSFHYRQMLSKSNYDCSKMKVSSYKLWAYEVCEKGVLYCMRQHGRMIRIRNLCQDNLRISRDLHWCMWCKMPDLLSIHLLVTAGLKIYTMQNAEQKITAFKTAILFVLTYNICP